MLNTYGSKDSVVHFVEALGSWIEGSLLKQIQKAHLYSIMADKCTDITTVEEFYIFCRWIEDGAPVEQFLGIEKADTVTIYSI